jgi:hypothetical protein
MKQHSTIRVNAEIIAMTAGLASNTSRWSSSAMISYALQ